MHCLSSAAAQITPPVVSLVKRLTRPPSSTVCYKAHCGMAAVPQALPALGGCDVPQASTVVQATAGYKVPQVVEGHPPHRLGMICVGGNTALLLKAPQLDT